MGMKWVWLGWIDNSFANMGLGWVGLGWIDKPSRYGLGWVGLDRQALPLWGVVGLGWVG